MDACHSLHAPAACTPATCTGDMRQPSKDHYYCRRVEVEPPHGSGYLCAQRRRSGFTSTYVVFNLWCVVVVVEMLESWG